MKKTLITAIVISSLTPSVWATLYDQNITAIFGSGNPNTGWTTTDPGDPQLGLRAKNRDNASTANVNGVYSYAPGFAVSNPARALWNWEFSINSGSSGNLSVAFDYYVGIDTDSSAGISYSVVNALTFWNDNAYGNNSTLNGQGTVGTSAALAPLNNVAQQSQNLVFAGGNPNLDATYNYILYAVDKNAGEFGSRLAEVGITVVVGNGGASVPDAGSTITLLGLALTGLGFAARRARA